VAGKPPASRGLLRRRTGGRGGFVLVVFILRCLLNIHRERSRRHIATYKNQECQAEDIWIGTSMQKSSVHKPFKSVAAQRGKEIR